MTPLCKSCRHKVGARHAPWCAIGNLDGPVLASECGEAVYQRFADGEFLTLREWQEVEASESVILRSTREVYDHA